MNSNDITEILEQYLEGPGQMSTGYQLIDSFGYIIRLAISVCTIIGLWKMFDKAGENGWGAIIPFYKDYLLFKVAEIKSWFWGYLAAGLVSGICLFVAGCYFLVYFIAGIFGGSREMEGSVGAMTVMLMIGVILCVFNFILCIFRAIKLTQTYMIGGGWAVGLIFLPWLFYMIIGCSKNIHHKNYPFGVPKPQVGPQPGYQQNPYQQNPYQQTGYQQTGYQQNPYQNNYYTQNTAQADQPAPLDPYANNPYMQNQTVQAPQNVQPAQPAQNPYAQAPDGSQNPYQNPPKDQVWNTIYDDNKNNLS